LARRRPISDIEEEEEEGKLTSPPHDWSQFGSSANCPAKCWRTIFHHTHNRCQQAHSTQRYRINIALWNACRSNLFVINQCHYNSVIITLLETKQTTCNNTISGLSHAQHYCKWK